MDKQKPKNKYLISALIAGGVLILVPLIYFFAKPDLYEGRITPDLNKNQQSTEKQTEIDTERELSRFMETTNKNGIITFDITTDQEVLFWAEQGAGEFEVVTKESAEAEQTPNKATERTKPQTEELQVKVNAVCTYNTDSTSDQYPYIVNYQIENPEDFPDADARWFFEGDSLIKEGDYDFDANYHEGKIEQSSQSRYYSEDVNKDSKFEVLIQVKKDQEYIYQLNEIQCPEMPKISMTCDYNDKSYGDTSPYMITYETIVPENYPEVDEVRWFFAGDSLSSKGGFKYGATYHQGELEDNKQVRYYNEDIFTDKEFLTSIQFGSEDNLSYSKEITSAPSCPRLPSITAECNHNFDTFSDKYPFKVTVKIDKPEDYPTIQKIRWFFSGDSLASLEDFPNADYSEDTGSITQRIRYFTEQLLNDENFLINVEYETANFSRDLQIEEVTCQNLPELSASCALNKDDFGSEYPYKITYKLAVPPRTNNINLVRWFFEAEDIYAEGEQDPTYFEGTALENAQVRYYKDISEDETYTTYLVLLTDEGEYHLSINDNTEIECPKIQQILPPVVSPVIPLAINIPLDLELEADLSNPDCPNGCLKLSWSKPADKSDAQIDSYNIKRYSKAKQAEEEEYQEYEDEYLTEVLECENSPCEQNVFFTVSDDEQYKVELKAIYKDGTESETAEVAYPPVTSTIGKSFLAETLFTDVFKINADGYSASQKNPILVTEGDKVIFTPSKNSTGKHLYIKIEGVTYKLEL